MAQDCFNAVSLEREYTILTNPVVPGDPDSGEMGYGPLALGSRWLACSGSLVEVSNADYVSPQQLTPSATSPRAASNGSTCSSLCKGVSKHLATGIVTLGDIGYKKLSHYCSELLLDSNHTLQSGVIGGKSNGIVNHRPRSMGGWQPQPAVFNQQTLFTSGPPVTLSVVSRIRNGNNGWRGTANGAAAVATGNNGSLCGAIAAIFHLCKDKNWHVDAIDWKSKYDLLLFSPSGYLIQYALRVSLELDTEACIAGVSAAFESAPGSDSKLIIEAMQKWNICEKQ